MRDREDGTQNSDLRLNLPHPSFCALQISFQTRNTFKLCKIVSQLWYPAPQLIPTSKKNSNPTLRANHPRIRSNRLGDTLSRSDENELCSCCSIRASSAVELGLAPATARKERKSGRCRTWTRRNTHDDGHRLRTFGKESGTLNRENLFTLQYCSVQFCDSVPTEPRLYSHERQVTENSPKNVCLVCLVDCQRIG